MKVLSLILVAIFLAGCTASNLKTMTQTVTLPDGAQCEALTVEAGAPAGLNSRAHYLFQGGKLVAANAVGGDGFVNNMFKDSVGQAISGTAIGLGVNAAGHAIKLNQNVTVP